MYIYIWHKKTNETYVQKKWLAIAFPIILNRFLKRHNKLLIYLLVKNYRQDSFV